MKFEEWFEKNLIYCEDTHSFVHRLYDKMQDRCCLNHKEAQQFAWEAKKEMEEEFDTP